MNSKSTFYNTLVLSVIVQVITGIIEFGTLFVPVKIPLLKQLLVLEVTVQAIESLFYIWLFINFLQSSLAKFALFVKSYRLEVIGK